MHKPQEGLQIDEPFLLGMGVAGVEAGRNDELEFFCFHFVGLITADAGFESEEMLGVDPVGFRQYLPPSVLAGGFDAQHVKRC